MSTVVKQAAFISEEEYLKAELNREIKHEYVAGKIIAMAGASPIGVQNAFWADFRLISPLGNTNNQ